MMIVSISSQVSHHHDISSLISVKIEVVLQKIFFLITMSYIAVVISVIILRFLTRCCSNFSRTCTDGALNNFSFDGMRE